MWDKSWGNFGEPFLKSSHRYANKNNYFFHLFSPETCLSHSWNYFIKSKYVFIYIASFKIKAQAQTSHQIKTTNMEIDTKILLTKQNKTPPVLTEENLSDLIWFYPLRILNFCPKTHESIKLVYKCKSWPKCRSEVIKLRSYSIL